MAGDKVRNRSIKKNKGKADEERKKSKKLKKEKDDTKVATKPISKSSANSSSSSYDGYAWLALFVPSLIYYLFIRVNSKSSEGFTQRGIFSHTSAYQSISTDVQCSFSKCDGMSTLFHIDYKQKQNNKLQKDSFLSQAVQEILSNDDDKQIFRFLNNPIWVHDDELGRGYLLISDMATNRIWRWETGGGPIPIGRTLHMERSGCRSNRTQCDMQSSQSLAVNEKHQTMIGSAGLAMTTTFDGNSVSEPRLFVSEIGENRIIRIEHDGARTPLVKPIQAWDLLYVPTFHDLVFTTLSNPAYLYALRQVHKIPPIPSTQSRAMHFENETLLEDGSLDIIYYGQSPNSQLSGVALAHNFKSVFVLERTTDGRHIVVNVELEERIEEEEDMDENEEDMELECDETGNCERKEAEEEEEEDLNACKVSVFFDATSLIPAEYENSEAFSAGGIQVDIHGNLYVAIHPIGVIIVNKIGDHVGTIPILTPSNKDPEIITSLAFGEDDYLYISTSTRLLRVRIQHDVKGMTMGVLKKSGHVAQQWISRCSSICGCWISRYPICSELRYASRI